MIVSDELAFAQAVPTVGFRVATAEEMQFRPKRGDSLPSGEILVFASMATGFREVVPDQLSPGLFRTFSELPDSAEAVVTFANRFGWLGTREQWQTSPPTPWSAGALLGRVSSEWLDDWFNERDELAEAIDVCELTESCSDTELRHYVRWTENLDGDGCGTWWYNPNPGPEGPPRRRAIIRIRKHKASGENTPTKEELDARHAEIQSIRTTDWVTTPSDRSPPDLSPTEVLTTLIDHTIAFQLQKMHLIRLSFGPAPQSGARMFQIQPVNLLALMWMQFARAVAGNKRYQKCRIPQCGKYFEVLAKHRGVKEFCSTACKLKHFRWRKQQAEELHQAGRTHAEIAAETDTDLNTIKSWLKAKRKNTKRGK